MATASGCARNTSRTSWPTGRLSIGSPFWQVTQTDRAIYDAMAALVCHGVFARFPKVRALSVENGSDWLHDLAKKLKKAERMNVGSFAEPPVDTLRRHVTAAPYYEEDVPALVELMGADQVVMGSDFPHAEGLAEPIRFVDELKGLDSDVVKSIMRDNGRRLLAPLS